MQNVKINPEMDFAEKSVRVSSWKFFRDNSGNAYKYFSPTSFHIFHGICRSIPAWIPPGGFSGFLPDFFFQDLNNFFLNSWISEFRLIFPGFFHGSPSCSRAVLLCGVSFRGFLGIASKVSEFILRFTNFSRSFFQDSSFEVPLAYSSRIFTQSFYSS